MRVESLPHAEIVALALAGSREAWDQLVVLHDRRVVLTLLARGLPLDRARDIAQETWAKLLERQQRGALERLELPGLAIAQAAFLAIDAGRRRSPRTEALDQSSAAAVVADPATDAEELLCSREDLKRALAELDRCPERARRVFSLVYDNPGATHAETARTLGLSVQRVRQTLCEVRARLRAAMEKS